MTDCDGESMIWLSEVEALLRCNDSNLRAAVEDLAHSREVVPLAKCVSPLASV